MIGNSAGTSETAGAVTFNSSADTVSVTSNSSSAPTTLTFANAAGSLRGQTSMTVNFVGAGGTLGGGGNNPTIKFTGTPYTGTNTHLLSNTSGSDTTIGWATVNGTEWAGYDPTNGIVAVSPTLTASDNTTLQTATSTKITLFNPSTSQTLTGAVATGTLKMTPGASGLSLATGSNAVTTNAVMLAGTTDFSVTGTAQFASSSSGTRYFYVTDPNTTLHIAQPYFDRLTLQQIGGRLPRS